MSLFNAIPVMPCTSMTKTIDFYTSKLGFKIQKAGNYTVLKRDNAELHFYVISAATKLQPANCFIITDNVEDLYTICSANDLVQPNGQITDLKYGKKEFAIKDNNGNVIRFGEEPS